MSKMGAFILELEEFENAALGLNDDESRALMEMFFNDDNERQYAWEQYLIRQRNAKRHNYVRDIYDEAVW